MLEKLQIYNTLSRKKEIFEPINHPFVGMYVCGPTVYGDPHLGHARSAITFDTVFRYLEHQGYKVRYVRNITDIGHLERDADDGEDKIVKKARIESLEPMEVVQKYTISYHNDMGALNVRRPSIEPLASGHITDQIEMIEKILEKDLAYEVNGSVYFNVKKYNKDKFYGKLSGRTLDDLLDNSSREENSRKLESQSEKKAPEDFSLWKKAAHEHIMKWKSPWSLGFPGWHLECSAMSTKYLGRQFDIHGGGMDLLFPHHECEIAQSQAIYESDPVKYWLHNNMITVNGQKMGKSLGNFINLKHLFNGHHKLLETAYSPMVVRFFILQAHYRSTLDFSNESLKAAQKAYLKMINGLKVASNLKYESEEMGVSGQEEEQAHKLIEKCYAAMNDDFNTALTIGHLFNILKKINSINLGQLKSGELKRETFDKLVNTFITFVTQILGLKEEKLTDTNRVVNILIKLYQRAKSEKNYYEVDQIRQELKEVGITLKDMKTGIDWAYL